MCTYLYGVGHVCVYVCVKELQLDISAWMGGRVICFQKTWKVIKIKLERDYF